MPSDVTRTVILIKKISCEYVYFFHFAIIAVFLVFFEMKGITTGYEEPPDSTPQYKIISPYTVNSRIDDKYFDELANMKKEFEAVKYFCATADIWSTKRKSFMGVTVHWVDEINLERKSRVALSPF